MSDIKKVERRDNATPLTIILENSYFSLYYYVNIRFIISSLKRIFKLYQL